MSTSSKLVSAALAAAVVVGVGYTQANAAGSAHHTPSGTVAGRASAAGSLNPQFTAHANVVHFYNTTATGGTGEVEFDIPNPGAGTYNATFTANFYPQGTPTAPVHLACSLEKNSKLVSESTQTGTYDSGFYLGVNGATTIKITGSDQLAMFCGTDDGTAWTWGSKSLSVSLTNMDGLVVGSLSQSKSDAHGTGAGTTK